MNLLLHQPDDMFSPTQHYTTIFRILSVRSARRRFNWICYIGQFSFYSAIVSRYQQQYIVHPSDSPNSMLGSHTEPNFANAWQLIANHKHQQLWAVSVRGRRTYYSEYWMERLHIVIWDDTFGVPAGWQFEGYRTDHEPRSLCRLLNLQQWGFTLAPHIRVQQPERK